jgi:hypothetical protein
MDSTQENEMRIRNLCAVAALCGGLVTLGTAQAAVQVTDWPANVPCTAIGRNVDGSYTLLTDVALPDGAIFAAGMTFPAGGEYDVWATCGP